MLMHYVTMLPRIQIVSALLTTLPNNKLRPSVLTTHLANFDLDYHWLFQANTNPLLWVETYTLLWNGKNNDFHKISKYNHIFVKIWKASVILTSIISKNIAAKNNHFHEYTFSVLSTPSCSINHLEAKLLKNLGVTARLQKSNFCRLST